MTEVALGIDLGTGSTKAALVAPDGAVLAVHRAAHAIRAPDATTSQSDPADWLASVRGAVAPLLARHPDLRVATVGLSGQMHGVVCTAASGAAVRPAVLWSDRRAHPALAGLRAALDDDLGDSLANPLVAGMAGPILTVLQRDDPALAARSRWYLQPKDWLRLQLTGVAVTDPSDASATLLWDVTGDRWSEAAADLFGVPLDHLPPVHPSGAVAGTVSEAAAALLGVASGVPVAVGAADTAAALLGAGVAVGQTQVTVGTGGQIARVLDTPHADPTRRTHLYRAAIPDRWYAMAAIQNAGIAVDWARTVLAPTPAELDAALCTDDAGGVVFLPYLTGERTPHLDAGLTGRWVGLTPATSRVELLRAVHRGVAFALRDALDALRAVGHPIDAARLAGGGTRDHAWQQLLADVLGIPLQLREIADASVRGAAVLAWQAVGHRVPAPDGADTAEQLAPRPGGDDGLSSFHAAVRELTGGRPAASRLPEPGGRLRG